MPRSKRSTLLNLTKIQKKGKEEKDKFISKIGDALPKYRYIYVINYHQMRNSHIKELREDWKGSLIVMGKVKLLSKAINLYAEDLGNNKNSSESMTKLSNHIHGTSGILLTNAAPKVVEDYFNKFVRKDFLRYGNLATATIEVPKGVLYSRAGCIPAALDLPVPHSNEPLLRKLGMPTSLKNGQIHLLADYTICQEGQTLTADQSHLLKQFGFALAEFKIDVECFLDSKTSKLKVFKTGN